MSSSLLQDVLRSHTLEKRLNGAIFARPSTNSDRDEHDSDDEFINVVSLPGTPARSRPVTRPTSPIADDSEFELVNIDSTPGTPARSSPSSRTTSPTRGASARLARGPLHLTKTDPLKALPTDISQRIFGSLPIKDLAKCARVSKKWSRSQTINYVWFQHYRKENFHDDSLPPGKWTKRESKQNWRIMYLQSSSSRSPAMNSRGSGSGYTSPSSGLSGYQTPRELKEEKWRAEAEITSKPGKVEMRGMYKELGGRKSRGKTKLGREGAGVRDKGGWEGGGGDDDGY